MNQIWENGEKSNFRSNFGLFGLNLGPINFFSRVVPLLDVKHCYKLLLHAISRETKDPNSRKWPIASSWAWFKNVGPKSGPLTF